MAARPHDDDTSSHRSSLKSVFHELLGEGLAKKVAELPFLVDRTEREGKLFISRQRRETSKGEVKKFSMSWYRRLGKHEAMEALGKLPDRVPKHIEKCLADAMTEGVPIWHVLVKGVDPPRKNLPVSIYFLQNLEELSEFARECLIDFLDQDDVSALQQAMANPQFRDWCRQWYELSEDVNDERSIRYICRLAGCQVLTHCVRSDFGECTEFLLQQHSDVTAPQRWLVLAEPMRYFGRFQVNAFHEAAYNGAAAALDALIRYGNAHQIPWREAVDIDGKNALEIARSQVEKGRSGAETCVMRLSREYSSNVDMPAPPRAETRTESVLIVTWKGDDDEELHRHRQPLPLEASWRDLVAASRAALLNPPSTPGRPVIMVYKASFVSSDFDAVMQFLELWIDSPSIGFFKSELKHPDSPNHICKALDALLKRPVAPAWTRAYLFGACSRVEMATQEEEPWQEELAVSLQTLATTLASRPELPLWRLDRFPARLLRAKDRHLSNVFAAALDVKHLIHHMDQGHEIYRFFWSRFTVIERNMMDKMRLLGDVDVRNIEDAIDPQAVVYVERCVSMWISSLRCGAGAPDALLRTGLVEANEHNRLVAEIDSALSAALLMRRTLPGLPGAVMRALPEDMRDLFRETSAQLREAFGGEKSQVQRKASSRLSQAACSQLRPAWHRKETHANAASRANLTIPKQNGSSIQPADSCSARGGAANADEEKSPIRYGAVDSLEQAQLRQALHVTRVEEEQRTAGSKAVVDLADAPKVRSLAAENTDGPPRSLELAPQALEQQTAQFAIGQASSRASDVSQLGAISEAPSACGSLVSVSDAEGHCFLVDSLFKAPKDLGLGHCLVAAQDLVEGSRVLAANGDILEVTARTIHEKQEQRLVKLETASATLVVTASHRVMVRKGQQSQTLRADALRLGETVFCTGNRTEKLLEMEDFPCRVDVVEITFQPDEPVEAFQAPTDVILSKGYGVARPARRTLKQPRAQRDNSSIPCTDFGDGW